MLSSSLSPLLPLFLLLLLLPPSVLSIPVPNGQVGRAEVECGEDTVEVIFITEREFRGRIFAVGHSNDTECVSRDVGRRTTAIVLPKSKCGVSVVRSTNPGGLFVNFKVFISFHPDFITKVDRGYEISCFYMEADKTVSFPLTVSNNPLAALSEQAEMPRCRYEVLDPFTKKPVTIATVGSKLLHQWTCDSTAPSLWCMTVHSCRVEDGQGTEFEILTSDGCAVDRYLLDQLEYGPGELQAQKEAHAFRFADRWVVNFDCAVRLDIRPESGECPHPVCPDLSLTQARRRRIREAGVARLTNEIVDEQVRAQSIHILDVDTGSTHSLYYLNAILNPPDLPGLAALNGADCRSPLFPTPALVVLVALSTVALILCAGVLARTRRGRK